MYGRDIEVGEVDADLGDVLFLEIPADGLAAAEAAGLLGTPTLLAQVQCYPVDPQTSTLLTNLVRQLAPHADVF